MSTPATARPEFIRYEEGLATTARQIVLVSGVDVPIFRLDLPKGLKGLAREQVARRQLGDRMGLGADQVQMRPFTPGAAADQWSRVLIADPDLLKQWRPLQARAVLPDYLSLPCAPDLWVFDTVSDIILARLECHDGFSTRAGLLTIMLDRALAEQKRPKAILVRSDIPILAEWAHHNGLTVVTAEQELEALGIERPALLANDELSCDLRADPMAARVQLARRVLPWRWPLLAGAVASALFAAEQIVVTRQVQTTTQQIQAATRQTVQTAFPDLGPLLDIRLQISRALTEQLGAQATDGQVDPVELGWRVATVVMDTQSTPEQLSYTSTEGVALTLRLPDFATVEALARSLRDAGLKVELVDSRASTNAQGVRAEYRIQPEARQ